MPMQAQRGGGGLVSNHSQPGIRRGWVVSTTLRPLYPRRNTRYHCTGGWMGPLVGLDVMENLRPTGIRSRTVQPVESRYTELSRPPKYKVQRKKYVCGENVEDR
jgi:hypothetical protein